MKRCFASSEPTGTVPRTERYAPIREQGLYTGAALMVERRRIKHTISLEDRLGEEARRLREEAESLPHGPVREAALRRARQAETGASMSEWLRPYGLQPPK